MIKRSHAALAAALSLLVGTPALAADNYPYAAGGVTRTQRATEIGGTTRSWFIPSNTAGNELFTDANPATVKLPSGQVVVIGAGSAAIGSVNVTALPALPAGANAIGSVIVSNLPATQPVSAVALPLPTGAATSAKQPALGTAGVPSTDVLTMQGSATGTPLPAETIIRSTSVNRGAVLTTAGTAQTLVPANVTRRGLAIQNRNAPGASYSVTTSVFMSCQATATQDFNSLEIPAGALYETPGHHTGTGACSFVSGTAATPVYVREF